MSQGAKIDPHFPHIACLLVIKKFLSFWRPLEAELTFAIYGKLSNPSVLPAMKLIVKIKE